MTCFALLLCSCGGLEENPPKPASANGPVSPTTTGKPLFVLVNNKTPLEWATLLNQNVKPSDTSYQHKDGPVTWAGQAGAQSYASHTDCSGFINALLIQSFGLKPQDFQLWLNTRRPLAETYYKAIISQDGFTRIEQVGEMKPGDLIAIRYPPGYGGDNTGHIMVVAGLPQGRPPSKPEISGTEQWEVPVIDSSESGHGPKDTRYIETGTFREGLGQGTFRLYSQFSGKVTGYAWSNFTNSDYFDMTTRPLVIGRLDLAFQRGS